MPEILARAEPATVRQRWVGAGTPLLGFYTMGEIARITGSRGMRHLTCVTLALS